MIRSVRDKETLAIFKGEYIKNFSKDISIKAHEKLLIMHEVKSLEDLRFPPSNYLEKLLGDRKYQYSIRIKGKNPFLLCFTPKEDGFHDVEITDYHQIKEATMNFSIEDIDKIDLSDVTTGEKLEPRHPGVFLQEEFLDALQMSQMALAKAIKVPPRRINEIVHGKRSITLDTALRLEAFLGMKAHFWLVLQEEYDLYHEKEKLKDILSSIHLSPKVKA